MEKLNKSLIYKENPVEVESTEVEGVMQDIKERIKPILLELKAEAEADKFGLVLGIDASGRVPALLLARVLQYKADIEIRFVAGNNNVDNEDRITRLAQLESYFSSSSFKEAVGDREVLIVDDIIASGTSIELTCEALRKAEIPYRVVALAWEDSELSSSQEEIEKLLSTSITAGTEYYPFEGTTPKIYGKQQMAGVQKGVGLFSKSIDKMAHDAEKDGQISRPKQNQEVLHRTRELINQHAREIAGEMGWLSS